MATVETDIMQMQTRIRAVRKLRRLTLQALADQVGTTPQTIQRLETGNMTVSVEWLQRIGRALDLPPATLIDNASGTNVRYMGDLSADGAITAGNCAQILLSVPGDDPMAIRVRARLGPYEPGTILVVNRLEKSERAKADGRDCLVELTSGGMLFRRIVLAKGGTTAFVPYDDRRGVERDLSIAWYAPVVMAVRFLAEDKP